MYSFNDSYFCSELKAADKFLSDKEANDEISLFPNYK